MSPERGVLLPEDRDRLDLLQVRGREVSEPRNVHQPWCHIWTTHDKPCNCGASFAPRAKLGAEHSGFAGGA